MRAQHSCCSRPTSTSKTPHTTRQTDKRHHSHLAVCKTICTLRVVRVSVRDPLLVNASLNASLSLSRKNLSQPHAQPPLSGPRGVCLSQRGKTRDQNVSRSSSRARARARTRDCRLATPLRTLHTRVRDTETQRPREWPTRPHATGQHLVDRRARAGPWQVHGGVYRGRHRVQITSYFRCVCVQRYMMGLFHVTAVPGCVAIDYRTRKQNTKKQKKYLSNRNRSTARTSVVLT